MEIGASKMVRYLTAGVISALALPAAVCAAYFCPVQPEGQPKVISEGSLTSACRESGVWDIWVSLSLPGLRRLPHRLPGMLRIEYILFDQ